MNAFDWRKKPILQLQLEIDIKPTKISNHSKSFREWNVENDNYFDTKLSERAGLTACISHTKWTFDDFL